MTTTYTPTSGSALERAIKAKAIFHAPNAIRNLDGTRYWVAASDGRGGYVADLDQRTCSCADHRHRGVWCKHLQAAWEFWRHEEFPKRPECRIRVQVDEAGRITGWGYAEGADVERQERVARGKAAAAELFPS